MDYDNSFRDKAIIKEASDYDINIFTTITTTLMIK